MVDFSETPNVKRGVEKLLEGSSAPTKMPEQGAEQAVRISGGLLKFFAGLIAGLSGALHK